VSLGESDSAKVWTWPVNVATWLLKLSPPVWLWARDHAGRLHWFRLPANIVEAIRKEWPTAQAQVAKAEAEKRGLTADQIMVERAKLNPAGRFGDPEEFGEACAFLCSARSGFITGQNILLDGGAFPGTL
jgi:hypothetical protein